MDQQRSHIACVTQVNQNNSIEWMLHNSVTQLKMKKSLNLCIVIAITPPNYAHINSDSLVTAV